MNDESVADLGRQLFEDCLSVFLEPELESRYQRGDLARPLPWAMAQVIFMPDGRRPVVKFDAEVSGKVFMAMRAGAVPNNDGVFSWEDLEEIHEIEFNYEDHPDCAYATFFRRGDAYWCSLFDLRLNRQLAQTHLSHARMFYKAALDASAREHWPPFVDNLFSATELTARGLLLLTADKGFREKATHKAVKARFNRAVTSLNIPGTHQQAFNKLSELRDNARYMRGACLITKLEAKQLLVDVDSMIQRAQNAL